MALGVLGRRRDHPRLAVWLTFGLNDTFGLFVVVAAMMVIGYGVVGGFLATRVPRNPIGWLMLVIAVSFALVGVGGRIPQVHAPDLTGIAPVAEAIAWLSGFVFYGVLIPLLVILLVFPDGTLLSPRWRIVLMPRS